MPRPVPAAKASVGDPGNPATWRLPIETYLSTKVQSSTVFVERGKLMDACMEKAGFPNWEPAPELPPIGAETLVDRRYGIHDAELAARRGYHPDEKQMAARDAALAIGAVDGSGADPEVERKCFEATEEIIPSFPSTILPDQIGGQSWEKAAKHPKVVQAFADWSACMKVKGFTYDKPMDANDDPNFASKIPSELETKTAVADIDCRAEHNVARVWFDTEAALQQPEIEKHQTALEKLRADHNEVAAAAIRARR